MIALGNLIQFQDMNGSLLAAGYVFVYHLGRSELATIYNDHNGAHVADNPVRLDDMGMCDVYLNECYNYTVVVMDAYGQEMFSRDIYPDKAGGGDGRYEGVDPIVVNNDVNVISANTTRFGVQEPLYFVRDDESATIIGFSGSEVPEGTMNESAFGYQDGKITGYNGSAFSAGNTYEEGSYIDINGNTISVTGLTPVPADTASTGLVASVSADITAMIPDTSDMATQTWVNEQGYLTGVDLTPYQTTADMSGYLKTDESAKFYTTANESGFINSDAISSMATTGFVAGVSADITAMIPTALTGDYLTKESADTLYQTIGNYQTAGNYQEALTFNYTNDDEISGINGSAIYGQGGGVTGDYELSAGSGISIVDYPLEQKTVISVTAQGGNPEVEQAVIDNSATWNTVADKLDTTAFSDVSGTFLTALPSDLVYTADIADMATTGDLTDKQDVTGMTAYATVESLTAKQDAGDYLSATDSANFLLTSDSANFYPSDNPSAFITGVDLTPYQLTADMTAYQSVGDYLTTADSANFYTTANESGFITGVPAGTMNESAFGYDASDNITAYNGSAFKAGDEFPQSATEAIETVTANSADWNGTTDTVSSNSGAWGGSALPISAGPGIKFEMVNNTLVASTDETVLYDSSALISTDKALGTTFNISEPVSNFEKFKVYYTRFPWTDQCPTHQIQEFDATVPVNVIVLHTTFAISTATNPSWYDCTETITDITGTTWKLNSCSQMQLPNGNIDSSHIYLKPYKVIGINRIARGN